MATCANLPHIVREATLLLLVGDECAGCWRLLRNEDSVRRLRTAGSRNQGEAK